MLSCPTGWDSLVVDLSLQDNHFNLKWHLGTLTEHLVFDLGGQDSKISLLRRLWCGHLCPRYRGRGPGSGERVEGRGGCSAGESGGEAQKKRLKPTAALRFHEARVSQVRVSNAIKQLRQMHANNTVLLISWNRLNPKTLVQFKDKQIFRTQEEPALSLKPEGRGLSPGHQWVTRMRSPRSGGACRNRDVFCITVYCTYLGVNVQLLSSDQ